MAAIQTWQVRVVRVDAGATLPDTRKAAVYEVQARSRETAEGAAEGQARREFGGRWTTDQSRQVG